MELGLKSKSLLLPMGVFLFYKSQRLSEGDNGSYVSMAKCNISDLHLEMTHLQLRMVEVAPVAT